MSNSIDDIKKMWSDTREANSDQTIDTGQIIAMAEKKKRDRVKSYLGTIIVLLVTTAILLTYFIYVANFHQLTSKIGIGLMLGILALRIVIELVSIYFSTKISLSEIAIKTNNALLKFYYFRKNIHNPISVIFIVLYTIGFYLLTPEFCRFFSIPIMILMDGSYIIGAAVFTWSIRKAIRKEMHELSEIIRIQSYIT
jgi:hypothetical protein